MVQCCFVAVYFTVPQRNETCSCLSPWQKPFLSSTQSRAGTRSMLNGFIGVVLANPGVGSAGGLGKARANAAAGGGSWWH